MKAKQIVLAKRPEGMPTKAIFREEDKALKEIKEGEVLLNPLYISVDPYMRGRMRDEKSYVPPYELGQPITGGIVAEVEKTKSADFDIGDKVLGDLPWATKLVAKASDIRKVEPSIPESYHLGIAGMPGLTAYFGMTDICA